MTKQFAFTITQARVYTIKLEACNANYTGSITATARAVYSQQWYGPGGSSRLYVGQRLAQYPGMDSYKFPTGTPVTLPEISLPVLASGKSISVTVPFGAGQNPAFNTTPEYVVGGTPRLYVYEVKHNGIDVLRGAIEVAITGGGGGGGGGGGQQPAGFSICNAKAT